MAMHDMNRAKGFPCKECDIICPSTPSLLEHMKAHYHQEDNGRFECEQCGRIFKHASSLASHKKTHEMGSFQCPVCTRTLPNAVALKNHLRIHTLSPSAQAEEENDDNVDEDRDYNLAQDLSDAAFRSHINNSGMMPGHDHDKQKSPGSEDAWDRPFKCDQCDRTYRHHGSLDQESGATTPISLPGNLGDAAHFVPDSSHNSGLDSLEFHDRFNGSLAQSSSGHSPLPQSHRQANNVNQGGMTNGYMGNMTFHSPGGASLPAGSANLKESTRQRRSHDQMQFGGVQDNSQGNSKRMDNKDDDDGEVYQCTVCGNHYASLRALRSHLRSHGVNQGAGPSSALSPIDRHQLITHLCPGKARAGSLNKGMNGAKGMTGGASTSGSRGPVDPRQMPDSDDRPHRHKCEECGKAFKIQKQLINHLRLHEEHRAKTGDRDQRVQSMSHPNGVRYEGGPSQLQAMRMGDPKIQNPPVNTNYGQPQGFKKPYAGARSQQVDDGSGRRPFACDQCGRTYRHAGSLANHKNLHKIGEYHCNVCNSTYPNRLAMKNHLRMHFALKKYTCSDCGRGFRNQRQLETHTSNQLCKDLPGPLPGPSMQTAPPPTEYECDGCSQVFNTTTDLASHNCSAQLPSSSASLNSSNMSMDTVDLGSPEREERPFTCDLCGCSYKHASSLLNHKNTHKIGNFSCSYCDKPYTNYMALRNHMRIHTQKKRHICSTCGKAFRLARFLRNHQRVHEEGHTRFGCPTCGKSFQGRSGLARHRCGDNQVGKEGMRKAIPSTREGEEYRFTCDQCGRSYRHASSLLNHKNTHTVGIYHCAVCPKTYSNLLALKNHRRIHSETRRHRCPECGKAFRVSSQLQNHSRVHQKEREFTCTLCQRNFPTQASFRLHLEMQHGCAPKTLQQPGVSSSGSDVGWGSGLDLTLMQAQGLDPNGLRKLNPSHHGPSGSSSSGNQQQQQHQSCSEAGCKSHVCDQCGRGYRHASSLLNHKNSHKMGTYFCNSFLELPVLGFLVSTPPFSRGYRTQSQEWQDS
ncbi:hypothetical protein cypCar_00016628 [Cyprinus carpio]|nr:hypothetical protein cypCar_00016628 [Cyprinus carpio]